MTPAHMSLFIRLSPVNSLQIFPRHINYRRKTANIHDFLLQYIQLYQNDKRSKDSYKPDRDAPKSGPISMIATKEKREGRSQSEEHVVVGLVLADNAFKYSDKSSTDGKNKVLTSQRVQRGILPPESNILRATVPVTEFIETSHKYYVLCQ
jgi:hypothetical protein